MGCVEEQDAGLSFDSAELNSTIVGEGKPSRFNQSPNRAPKGIDVDFTPTRSNLREVEWLGMLENLEK